MDEVTLAKNATHTVKLRGLGTAGYQWSATIDDPRVVRVEKLIQTEMPSGLPMGRSVDEEFVITAVSTGETAVHFVQTRPFGPEKPPHSTYDLLVHVSGD